ncbi:MAG: hypothetical protein JW834_02385 [Candidatus Diapherotrites archaeon]|nr:hypothetical protein [Candidatus Diapherotrites archaeon]
MDKEDTAFKLVELYVREVSKSHEKRQMGLDTIMNAYFYALMRIERKQKEMEAIGTAIQREASLKKEEAPEIPKPKEEAFEFE